MSATSLTAEDREDICATVGFDIVASYMDRLERKMELLQEQDPLHEVYLKYDQTLSQYRSVSGSLKDRKSYVRANLEDVMVSTLDAIIGEDDQPLSFEDYKALIPQFLARLGVECEKLRPMFSDAYLEDTKFKLGQSIDQLSAVIQDGKNTPTGKEIELLNVKLAAFRSGQLDPYVDDIIKFMQETEPELYQKYLEVYAYYQQPGAKDEFTICPNCEQGVPVDRLLRYDVLAHMSYGKKKKKFMCEEAKNV